MAESERERRREEKAENGEPAAGTRFSAKEIHENVKVAAEEELERPVAALALSSLAAGLAIGFSFVGAAYLASLVGADAEPALRHAAAAAAYPLGFIFVVLGRSQLFTEHTLEPLIPLFARPTASMLGKVLRLYAIVLGGNLVGTLVFASVLALTPMVRTELHPSLAEVARAAFEGGFGTVLYKAIFGGWLIALMAWLIASTRATGAQLLFIWLTTAPIAAFGFRHSVAGAAEMFYLALRGFIGWGDAFAGFIVPAVIGNVLGGGIIVALLAHGQVTADLKHEEEHDREVRQRYARRRRLFG